jgi:cytochrome c biogenesis protein CcmG/thiol:disulfide interchange protein DsbE
MSSTTPPQSRRAARAAELARAEKRRRTTKIAVIAAGVAIVVGVGIAAIGLRGATPTADTSGQAYLATKDNFRLPGLLDTTKTVSLADHKGKPVVVNFFASWCVYCNEELPGFVQVAKNTTGTVDFIGVDTNDPGDGLAMAKRFDLAGVGFALAHDIGANPASDLWLSYGSQGLPVTAFYDKDGQLVDFAGGMLTQTELEQRIAKNFGITVTAPDASTMAAPVIPLIPKGVYELLNAHGNATNYFAVDVRSAADFAGGHLPGAKNLPSATAATVVSQASSFSKDGSYFLYDADGKATEPIAQALHDAGFKHVYYLEGGLAAWIAAQGPTE